MQPLTRSATLRYGFAVAAVAGAALLKVILGPELSGGFLVFYGALVLAAWHGGLGPGLLATLLSTIAGTAFLMPIASLHVLVRPAFFVLFAVPWAWLASAKGRSQEELAVLAAQRTAELSSTNVALQAQIAEAQVTERILRQSEDQLREQRNFGFAVLDTIGALVGAVDRHGRIVRFNRACQQALGYSLKEAIGRYFWDLLPVADEVGPAKAVFEKLLSGNWPTEYETYWITRDGQRRELQWSTGFMRNAAGAVEYVIGSGIDITRLKRTEAGLRVSEERYVLAVSAAKAGVWDWDPKARTLQFSPQCLRILNFEEVDPQRYVETWNEYIHPDDREWVAKELEMNLQGVSGQFQGEFRHRLADGSYRWILSRGSAIHDRNGKPYRMLGVLTDITERKQMEESLRRAHDELEDRVAQRTADLTTANRRLQEEITRRQQTEQALRASEQRFRGIFDQAAVGVAMVGNDGRWSLVNQKLCDILGYPAEELQQLTFLDVTHPDDLEKHLEYVQRVASGALQTYSIEKRYIRKDGASVWARVAVAGLRDSAGALYGVVIIEDISERKRAEQEIADLNQQQLAILERITDGFFALDNHGRFTYVNPSAKRMMTRPPVIGEQLREVFPEAVEAFGSQYELVLAERIGVDREIYYAPRNRWIHFRAYPSAEGISVFFEEVTERYARELAITSDILSALNAALNVVDAFPSVAADLRALVNCDRSSLVLFDDAGEWATVAALDHVRRDLSPGSRLRLDDIAHPDVVKGSPHIVPDMAVWLQSPIAQALYDDGMRSTLSLPLLGSRISGMLTLTWRTVGAASEVHLPLLSQIAKALALAVEKSRLFEQVSEGRERLQALSRRLMEVQEAERRNIARELHDEIGQNLTGLKLVLDALKRAPEGMAHRLGEAQTLVDDLVSRVRDLSLDLRPAMLDDLGLLPAVLWFFERYTKQTEVHVAFEHQGLARRFPPEVETAAYRVVQEALTNVARHAGARRATVRLWADQSTLTVQVVDEGKGFDPARALDAHLTGGLPGMRERAQLLGGQLIVESVPGGGTRITAELPLHDGLEGRPDNGHDSAGG